MSEQSGYYDQNPYFEWLDSSQRIAREREWNIFGTPVSVEHKRYREQQQRNMEQQQQQQRYDAPPRIEYARPAVAQVRIETHPATYEGETSFAAPSGQGDNQHQEHWSSPPRVDHVNYHNSTSGVAVQIQPDFGHSPRQAIIQGPEHQLKISIHSGNDGWHHGIDATLCNDTLENWISIDLANSLSLDVRNGLQTRYLTLDGRQLITSATVKPTWSFRGHDSTFSEVEFQVVQDAPFSVLLGTSTRYLTNRDYFPR